LDYYYYYYYQYADDTQLHLAMSVDNTAAGLSVLYGRGIILDGGREETKKNIFSST